ncbi:MAG: choice-of-anchor D domain-containing protein [Thermofilaceae archaeon]
MLQEALADPQLQAVKAQLERRGLSIKADEAQAVQLAGGQQVLIPFGEDAHLVWTRANGQSAAVGLIRQGNKTLNVSADGQERVVRFLPVQKVEKLVRKLREKSKFQEFEGKLAQKGKRVGKIRALFDETNKIAILGIASEGDEEKIVHQVRIKVKPDKDDEPEENAEPAIQATACGQATGEAVPEGAKLQPLAVPPGEGDIEGGYEGPQICTSQWGYDYLCISRTPAISLSTTSLTLPQTFINQQTQASFIIWNSGGGTLSGTVSVPAPFSIASGASFSLLPGQPQEVVVKFSSATPGSFSKSISISSNAGSKTITATGIAHKVSFSPAQLDFGSGLLVLREQCNNMDVCGLRTEKVGLPIEKSLTVKNEGSVAVTLTLSTSAPYKIVSVLPTLSPGQSAQVTVRFDPSESGSFTGAVQVGINGGQGSVTSPPLVGVVHKVEIDPAVLNFRLIFTGRAGTLPFTVKNQGVTSVALTASTDGPFSIIGGNSFALAPSESRQITVQFSPTRSGDFMGSLRLSVGAATTVVPIAATSRTVAEFLQMLSNLNDPMSSVGNYYSMLYVENAGYQLDMILAGFARLTEEDLNNWLNSAPSLADSGAMPDPQLVEALLVLDSIGAETIVGWLSQLAQAVQENHFDEVYDNLLTQGFSQVEQAFMVLLGTSNGSEVRGFFLQLVQSEQQQPGGGWRDLLKALVSMSMENLGWESSITLCHSGPPYFPHYVMVQLVPPQKLIL